MAQNREAVLQQQEAVFGVCLLGFFILMAVIGPIFYSTVTARISWSTPWRPQ